MNIEEKRKQLREMDDFFYFLLDDVLAATSAREVEPSDFTRRCYIRSVMSFIEGNTFRFKQVALWIHENIQPIFSEKEIGCLREKTVFLKDNGEAGEKEMHIKMLPNVHFSLKSYAKAMNIEFELVPVSDKSWESLKEAIGKRNKITHPKTIDDFRVTEEDIVLFEKAASLYREITLPLIGPQNEQF